MFGLLFGGRRRSPALFYLRLGLLAALLLATFVFHFSTTDLVALRIARIALVVLFIAGARFAGPGRRLAGRGRPSPSMDAPTGESSQWPTDKQA